MFLIFQECSEVSTVSGRSATIVRMSSQVAISTIVVGVADFLK